MAGPTFHEPLPEQRLPRPPRGPAIAVAGARRALWRRARLRLLEFIPIAAVSVAIDVIAAATSVPLSRPLTVVLAAIHAGALTLTIDAIRHLAVIERMRRAMARHRWKMYRIQSLQAGRPRHAGMELRAADGGRYFVQFEVSKRESEQRSLGGRAVWVAGDLAKHAVLTAPGGGELHYTSLAVAWNAGPPGS